MVDPKDTAASKAKRKLIAAHKDALKFGSVYYVQDGLVELPAQRDRKPHENGRRVVVMQDRASTLVEGMRTVLVAPASGSSPAGPFDLDIDWETEPAFTELPTIYVSLVQPMLIVELKECAGMCLDSTREKLSSLLGKLLAGV